MIVCSSFCANYIPKAAVMAESVKKHNPDITTVACMVERELTEEHARYLIHYDHIVLASELGIDHFESFMFKYDIVEASTAVKGQLFRYLMNHFDDTQFVYLDPDIKVYQPLHQLQQLLEEHPIVLTPHLLEPEDHDNARGIFENEIGAALTHGVFNLGFLAVNNSPEAVRFIDWWTTRLALYCYADMKDQGIFTDQGWIDLAPCFFDVFILKHPGYNVAHWNLSKRVIDRNQSEHTYTVNNSELVFYHFSEFVSGLDQSRVSKYIPDLNNPVYEIRSDYAADLERYGQNALARLPWSYATYFSGQLISRTTRILYRRIDVLREKYPLPFQESEQMLKDILPATIQNRTIYIWGAGEGGQRTLRFYQPLLPAVTGFMDKDAKKAGSWFQHLPVYHTEAILNAVDAEHTKPFVIIATMHFKAISEQLKSRGFVEGQDFIVSPVI